MNKRFENILLIIGCVLLVGTLVLYKTMDISLDYNKGKAANEAVITLVPSKTIVAPDEVFTVDVRVDSPNQYVSSADIKVVFPNSILQGVSIDPGTFLPTVLKNGSVNASTGTASIIMTMGVPDCEEGQECPIDKKGRIGSGTLATITFKAITAGSVTLSLTGTEVFAYGAPGNIATLSPVTFAVDTPSLPVPTATFSVDDDSITAGQSITLSWSSTNATAVLLDQGIGVVAPSGTKTVSPGSTTTYTLTVTGSGGTITKTVTVMVQQSDSAPTVSFSASSTSITAGQSATLTWSTSNATTISIDQGIGTVNASGTRTVSPTSTTTYTLTATGAGGTVTSSVLMTIISQTPTPTPSVQPSLRIDGALVSTRRQLEIFDLTLTNITPNSAVIRYVTPPGGQTMTLVVRTADQYGRVSWPYMAQCSAATGTYTVWAVDTATGRQSNTIQEIVTTHPQCIQASPTATPSQQGLREGDMISAAGTSDPDIYIINEHGYKRLFLNPIIFGFYGHLGGYGNVKTVTAGVRDTYVTSALFRNCETNDQKVYAVEVTGEDDAVLHHVQVSGSSAVAQDSNFFKKIFCINNREFAWYGKSTAPYTALNQIPVYRR